MISCSSYCCVRYGQCLYMVWFMDLSLHLHRQPPPPARASGISHCISFPLVGEIIGWGINPCECWDRHAWLLLVMAHTHLGGAKRENPEALVPKFWNLLVLSQGHLALGQLLWRRVERLCPPSVRVIHSAPDSHQCLLHATQSQVSAYFMITGMGILMLKERSEEFGL